MFQEILIFEIWKGCYWIWSCYWTFNDDFRAIYKYKKEKNSKDKRQISG